MHSDSPQFDASGHLPDDAQKDRIAREAARLMETGACDSIHEAIDAAADQLDAIDAPRPGKLRVRQHARMMSMQALGEAGYRQRITDMLRGAEELMTALEMGLPECETLLVGRAAQGLIDAGLTVNIRVYTDAPIRDIAAALVEFGYAEPEFETKDTRFGRMNRLNVVDDEREFDAVVTRVFRRCPADRETCLFTGKRLATATLPQLRAMIERQ